MPEITREAVEAAARKIHTLYDTATVDEQISAREAAVDALSAAAPLLIAAELDRQADALEAALQDAEPSNYEENDYAAGYTGGLHWAKEHAAARAAALRGGA